MNIHLVVVKSFDELRRGDVVTDPERISQVLNSEHARDVVRVGAAVNKGA